MKNDNTVFKSALKQFKDQLCTSFKQKQPITLLSRKLTEFTDALLINLFTKHNLHEDNDFCLLALGSYGRRELQLYSDVDLLLLHNENISENRLLKAQSFLQDCWDIGMNPSHQVTTVSDFASLAKEDVSVLSSALDMHLLCGRSFLMEELQYQTHPLHMWPSDSFFFAKVNEQKERDKKYDNTAYNLEPNVKYGPGGLRDIQTLLSIGKRHFNFQKLSDGISSGFITEKEYEELLHCEHFLRKVRFALHMIAEKAEERLLFDHQIKLAENFEYKDQPHSLAIEQFMKDYFKVIKRTRTLYEMLIQWFSETIIHEQKQKLIPLDSEFQLSNQYIEVRHPKVFQEKPTALLRIFYWLVKRNDIEGIRASTIRLIRQSLFLINNKFKSDTQTANLFMQIIRASNDPYLALRKMNLYGVLGHYLDSFAKVTGQMQYDLFHVFTVDQHTLFVMRNIARFHQEPYFKKFPLCAQIIKNIKQLDVLYLSALFHDIGKGQGGDHSEVGAMEAAKFAQNHHLAKGSEELLVWLVKHHLLMSQTAQRQDIYDPKTIKTFCQQLPKPDYLDYLYLLTVADICATNPHLWNSWKDSLLKELYNAASHVLHQQQELKEEHELIKERKAKALLILRKENLGPKQIRSLWKTIKGKYFLHESPQSIAQHTKAILDVTVYPLVLIMPHHSEGGTEVFIYMPHREDRFTLTTTILSNHHLTIMEAHILTTDNEYDLDTYIVLDEKNQSIVDQNQTKTIKQALINNLQRHNGLPAISKKRISRTLAHFKVHPKITYTDDPSRKQTKMFLVAADRHGLLAHIGRVLLSLNIRLHNAKIATAGERAEDMFYISNANNQILTTDEKDKLKNAITKSLENN